MSHAPAPSSGLAAAEAPMTDAQREIIRKLQVATGYMELGMADEALAKLAVLPDEPLALALGKEQIRVEVHRQRGQWEAMRRAALVCREAWPQAVRWWTSLAFATRRCPPDLCSSVEVPRPEMLPPREGWAILREAERRFPVEPIVLHNLAGYCRELGMRYEAAAYLRRAVRLDGRWRALILADRELAPLLNSLEPET